MAGWSDLKRTRRQWVTSPSLCEHARPRASKGIMRAHKVKHWGKNTTSFSILSILARMSWKACRGTWWGACAFASHRSFKAATALSVAAICSSNDLFFHIAEISVLTSVAFKWGTPLGSSTKRRKNHYIIWISKNKIKNLFCDGPARGWGRHSIVTLTSLQP